MSERENGLPVPTMKTAMETLPPLMDSAVAVLKKLGPEQSAYAPQFEGLKGRLLEGRFHLAVLGQFKRGKSTLLNALLSAEVLATSVVPLTAIPTFLSWCAQRQARIAFSDTKPPEDRAFPDDGALHDFLAAYVTETGKAVKAFEAKMAQALRSFQTRTDELIGAIRRTAAELFDIHTRPRKAPMPSGWSSSPTGSLTSGGQGSGPSRAAFWTGFLRRPPSRPARSPGLRNSFKPW